LRKKHAVKHKTARYYRTGLPNNKVRNSGKFYVLYKTIDYELVDIVFDVVY